MQNKTIIHVTYELYPENLGGIGIFVFNLINEMSKKNPERNFIVVVPVNENKFENRFEMDNVSIFFIKECYENNKLNLKLFCNQLCDFINSFNNDEIVIHFHDITLFHLMQKYKNIVYTFHKDDGISIYSSKKIKCCIYFTRVSQKKYFIPAEKKYVIPNGMKIEMKNAKIAYIGRNSVEKGFDKFIKYVETSKLQNKNIVIGVKDCVHEKIDSYGVLDTIQVNKELGKIDYIFVPSAKEEFGLVILEALNAGVKVFVQNLKQMKELFGDFKNVVFIDYTKDDYVKKIDNYIQKDFYVPQEKLLQFSIEKVAEKYIKVYDGI
jgi:glycosyltransferase involved in cell wall biosynthesis